MSASQASSGRMLDAERCLQTENDWVTIYFDGGAELKRGPAAGAAVLVATFLDLEVQLHAWASNQKLCYWEVTQVTSQTSSQTGVTTAKISGLG